MFIKAEILQEEIEVSKDDLDTNIPIRMRKTKLTEAEQQWYKKEAESGKGKWNSIKFNGAMTIEEYQ